VQVDIANFGEVPKETEARSMEELQLQNIKLLDEKDGQNFYAPEEKALIRKEEINTKYGKLHVTLHGTEGKPAIITFHDIGQNHVSAFQSFLNCAEMLPILQYFTIYHIDAPGQQDGAVQFPETFLYPSIDDLAEMVCDVVAHFKLKSFVGLGIGAGASILCRYGLKYPQLVDGLLLINCFSGKSGWVEWGYEKVPHFNYLKISFCFKLNNQLSNCWVEIIFKSLYI
jgi:pimeloyl-ACP methyl ester carboxylesterase